MSFAEAIKAIPRDLALQPTKVLKIKRTLSIAKLFYREALGLLELIPYGLSAKLIYLNAKNGKEIGAVDEDAENSHGTIQRHERKVLIKKDVRYDRLGTSERALMDVYVPSTKSVRASTVNEEEEGEDLMTTQGRKTPMAVFVHGGVWASGERWQFAPLAYRLAQEGICCAVISYSLFPEKRAKEQSEDVLNALRFALRMASVFGADENRTHLVGHSAGSHLCAMALLSNNEERNKETMIMPKVKSFIGLCGVYNIETHFEYEGTRGVSMLSTMGRAMGGNDKFKEMSPFHIVNNYESGENDFEHFPQTYLFSSLCDVVVPHRESKDFHDVLTKKGIKSELKIYDDGNHGDFALGFKKHPKNLKPYHKDLVELLLA